MKELGSDWAVVFPLWLSHHHPFLQTKADDQYLFSSSFPPPERLKMEMRKGKGEEENLGGQISKWVGGLFQYCQKKF